MSAHPHVGDETPTSATLPVAFPRFLLYYLGLGALGFGGPIAAVGYMQRDLVEERGWLDRQDLLDGIALGQTMPGPLAAQVAMWVGYLRRGAVGALGTAAAFILPSFVLVVGLAFVYGILRVSQAATPAPMLGPSFALFLAIYAGLAVFLPGSCRVALYRETEA